MLKRCLRETFRKDALRNLGVDLLIIPITDWKQKDSANMDMQAGMRKIEKALSC